MFKFLNLYFVLLACCLCIDLTNAYVAIERAHPNAAPNTCISTIHKITMISGEEIDVKGKCEKAMCKPNGQIIYHGCGVAMIPANCRFIDPDLSLPYPECCKREFECD